MAIEGGLCIGAKRDFLMGVHTPSDKYKLALYTTNASLGPLTEAYTSIGEVTGKGYEAGGRLLGGYVCGIDNDVGVLGWRDTVVWPDSTISAAGGLIYNASKGNKAIVVVDFGETITSTNGPFRCPMPPVTSATALVCIA